MSSIAGQQPPQQFGLQPQQHYQMPPEHFLSNSQVQQIPINRQAQYQANCLREMTNIFEQINNLQNDNTLRGYMTLTQHLQTINASSLTLATDDVDWLKEQSDPIALEDTITVKSLYSNIKKRNQELLKKTMDLRLKVSMLLYLSRIHSSKDQTQLQILNDRIRNVKMNISEKYGRLRLERLMAAKPEKKPTLVIPPNMPFNELKKGTQILQTEVLKLRQQLKIVIGITAKTAKTRNDRT